MSDAPKSIVESAYDHIAEWYLNWAQEDKSPREVYAEKVLQNAPASPQILELGGGSGIITRMLLDRGAHVIANDISTKQVEMAKARCPEATIIQGDMTGLTFDTEAFDGIICFFAIFHLPRAEQKDMLSKIYSWLKPGGMFVVNFATVDEEEIYGEMGGHGLFWSSYGVEHNKAMMQDVGFHLVHTVILESGDGKLEEDDPDYDTTFQWIVAKKKKGDDAKNDTTSSTS